jgi:hypothetical protein
MKTSLRLMIWRERELAGDIRQKRSKETDVFVLDVLEKFQFAISALREDRRAEGLHDLLDGNGGACKLILCGTGEGNCGMRGEIGFVDVPY